MSFTCDYCNKTFKRERTLSSHSCEKRRRHRNKGEKFSRIAYNAFNTFYKHTLRSKKDKTFDEFTNSNYYIAFIKFGNYCININAVNINKYILYLIKNEIVLNKWTSDTVYDNYLANLIKTESIEDALTRTINYSIAWGKEKNMEPHDLFRFGSSSRIKLGIQQGNISPWTIFQCNSGQQWFGSLDDNTINSILQFIDQNVWEQKFAIDEDDVTFAQTTLKHGGW